MRFIISRTVDMRSKKSEVVGYVFYDTETQDSVGLNIRDSILYCQEFGEELVNAYFNGREIVGTFIDLRDLTTYYVDSSLRSEPTGFIIAHETECGGYVVLDYKGRCTIVTAEDIRNNRLGFRLLNAFILPTTGRVVFKLRGNVAYGDCVGSGVFSPGQLGVIKAGLVAGVDVGYYTFAGFPMEVMQEIKAGLEFTVVGKGNGGFLKW